MKIGVISDTHGCAETWLKVYEKFFADADFIIHAGDVLYHGPRNSIPAEYNPRELAELLNNSPVPLIIACGNCDAEVDSMVLELPVQAPYCHIMVNSCRIIVNHGHLLTKAEQYKTAARYKAALFITGHTHIAKLERQDGVIFLNPGSPGMSKREDGRGTIALITRSKVEVLDAATGEVILAETLTEDLWKTI